TDAIAGPAHRQQSPGVRRSWLRGPGTGKDSRCPSRPSRFICQPSSDKPYLRVIEIFTALAALAGATHAGVWNVVALARAAPAWNASPSASPMLALHGVADVVQLTGMSLAACTSTT